MKITEITLSVFELPANTARFDLIEQLGPAKRRWTATRHLLQQAGDASTEPLHVLHVRTDEGIEGVCTVGDARYTTMQPGELEQLRILTVGANPLDRERLYAKLHAATRSMFTRPGWFWRF